VIAVTLDIGQGRELTDVRERALAVGATRAHVLDVRDEFAREYILSALQAEALYEDRYPLATALGRPLIARRLVDVARMEGTTVIAHGCNGKANDELRFEQGIKAIRQGTPNPDSLDNRQSLHCRHQPVGTFHRAWRARGSVAGIAGRHLRADPRAARLSG
jgi:hypothetical protein